MKIEKTSLNYSILILYLILSIIGLIVFIRQQVPGNSKWEVSSTLDVHNGDSFFILSLLTIALIYKFSLVLRNKSVGFCHLY